MCEIVSLVVSSSYNQVRRTLEVKVKDNQSLQGHSFYSCSQVYTVCAHHGVTEEGVLLPPNRVAQLRALHYGVAKLCRLLQRVPFTPGAISLSAMFGLLFHPTRLTNEIHVFCA